jgi:MFS family permease
MSTPDEKEFEQNGPSNAHHENHAAIEKTEKTKWGVRQTIAIVSLSILWVGKFMKTVPSCTTPANSLEGSQVPLYFTGGMLSYMAADLGGKALTSSSWIPVCNTLAVAAVAPFSGYFGDIFGRRNITLIGSLLIMIGCIVAATAHSFGAAVTGMSLAGAGAGIGELTALGG